MMNYNVVFDEEFFINDFDMTTDLKGNIIELVPVKRKIKLIFSIDFHKVRKARKDSLGQKMEVGETYAEIYGPVPTPLGLYRGGTQIRAEGKSEEEIADCYTNTPSFKRHRNYFLWVIKSQQWKSITEFLKFYFHADTRKKVCVDCGQTARKIRLKDNDGRTNWFFDFDRPGMVRCKECRMSKMTNEDKLNLALFDWTGDEMPFWA